MKCSVRSPVRIVAVIAAVLGAVAFTVVTYAVPPKLDPFRIPFADGGFKPKNAHVYPDVPQTGPAVVGVQFYRTPSRSVVQQLAGKGVLLGDRIHRTSYFAIIGSPSTNIRTVLDVTDVALGIRSVFRVRRDQKIEVSVSADPPLPYVFEDRPTDRRRAVVVFQKGYFQGGYLAQSQAAEAFLGAGRTHSHRPYSRPRLWSVVATKAQLEALADEPAVQSIRSQPSPRVTLLQPSMRLQTRLDQIQTTGTSSSEPRFEGPTGTDVTIAVFDCALPTDGTGALHEDLATLDTALDPVTANDWRVWMQDGYATSCPCGTNDCHDANGEVIECPSGSATCVESPHGNEVAGVMLGTGYRAAATSAPDCSTGTLPSGGDALPFRGAAPSARARMYAPDREAGEDALKPVVEVSDLSNHSYVTAPLVYGVYSHLLDKMVLGFPDDPGISSDGEVLVASAGNFAVKHPESIDEAACRPARGYYSLTGVSKNAIVVGATVAGAFEPEAAVRGPVSSLGPTLDGRLKPDVVAPGCRVCTAGEPATGPVTIAGTDDYTVTECGTSFAAAHVSGIVAVVSESVGRALRPATIKAGLISGAIDLEAEPDASCDAIVDCIVETGKTAGYGPGPDYATGFGLVQANATFDQLKSGRFVEGVLEYGSIHVEQVEVPEGASSFRVTLAWDDPADSVPTPVSPAIDHELDLLLIGPARNGVRSVQGPWIPAPLDWYRVAGDAATLASEEETAESGTCPEGYQGLDLIDISLRNEVPSAWRNQGEPPDATRCAATIDTGGGWSPEWVDLPVATGGDPDSCRDTRNNAEQVEVDEPTGGIWNVLVKYPESRSTNFDPQEFSLVWNVGTRVVDDPAIARHCYAFEDFSHRALTEWLEQPDRSCMSMRLDVLCQRHPDEPVCAINCVRDTCRIDIPEWPRWVRAEIRTEDGKTLDRDLRWFRTHKRLRFDRRRDRLVLYVYSKDGRPLNPGEFLYGSGR